MLPGAFGLSWAAHYFEQQIDIYIVLYVLGSSFNLRTSPPLRGFEPLRWLVVMRVYLVPFTLEYSLDTTFMYRYSTKYVNLFWIFSWLRPIA
jgi:hypothetical protein